MGMIQYVSLDMFKRFCVENGVPGAEAYGTDWLLFTGSIAGGVAGGGAVVQPPDVKLSDEYDYYLSEIRASANFGHYYSQATATIGGQAYVPMGEAQHLAFTLNSDGRNRPSLFRGGAMPLAQVLAGMAMPFEFPGPASFSGREKVQCAISTLGIYNPAAVAAMLDFTITVTCVIIKSQVLVEYEKYLKATGSR